MFTFALQKYCFFLIYASACIFLYKKEGRVFQFASEDGPRLDRKRTEVAAVRMSQAKNLFSV